MDIQLTKNFSLKKFTESSKAKELRIQNIPTQVETVNIKRLAENILQPLSDKIGPIKITSGYRCKALNAAVGGSKSSHHIVGMAADIKMDNMKEVFIYIAKNLEFTQLIWEYGTINEPDWIHVSYDPKNLKKEVLRKVKGSPYSKFIV